MRLQPRLRDPPRHLGDERPPQPCAPAPDRPQCRAGLLVEPARSLAACWRRSRTWRSSRPRALAAGAGPAASVPRGQDRRGPRLARDPAPAAGAPRAGPCRDHPAALRSLGRLAGQRAGSSEAAARDDASRRPARGILVDPPACERLSGKRTENLVCPSAVLAIPTQRGRFAAVMSGLSVNGDGPAPAVVQFVPTPLGGNPCRQFPRPSAGEASSSPWRS